MSVKKNILCVKNKKKLMDWKWILFIIKLWIKLIIGIKLKIFIFKNGD